MRRAIVRFEGAFVEIVTRNAGAIKPDVAAAGERAIRVAAMGRGVAIVRLERAFVLVGARNAIAGVSKIATTRK